METDINVDISTSNCGSGQSKPAINGVASARSNIALIFVHAQKTAGSMLSRIMDLEYSPRHICDIDGRFDYGRLQR